MAISTEMIWNRINAIGDEVHTIHEATTQNAKDVAVINERLNNHLAHQDKKTNQKLAVFGIIIAAGVSLLAMFISKLGI